MKSDITFLERVEVAAPCHADWEKMEGDERARFCQDCKLSVYNLSDMSKEAAESLLKAYEGKRLCVRFFRRKDGTILTSNCPVGLRRLRKIAVAKWSAMMTVVAALFYFPLQWFGNETTLSMIKSPQVQEPMPVMGDMMLTPVAEPHNAGVTGMIKIPAIATKGQMVLGEAVEGRISLKTDKNSP